MVNEIHNQWLNSPQQRLLVWLWTKVHNLPKREDMENEPEWCISICQSIFAFIVDDLKALYIDRDSVRKYEYNEICQNMSAMIKDILDITIGLDDQLRTLFKDTTRRSDFGESIHTNLRVSRSRGNRVGLFRAYTSRNFENFVGGAYMISQWEYTR